MQILDFKFSSKNGRSKWQTLNIDTLDLGECQHNYRRAAEIYITSFYRKSYMCHFYLWKIVFEKLVSFPATFYRELKM